MTFVQRLPCYLEGRLNTPIYRTIHTSSTTWHSKRQQQKHLHNPAPIINSRTENQMSDKRSTSVNENARSISNGPTSTLARLRTPLLPGIHGKPNAQNCTWARATLQAASSVPTVAATQQGSDSQAVHSPEAQSLQQQQQHDTELQMLPQQQRRRGGQQISTKAYVRSSTNG